MQKASRVIMMVCAVLLTGIPEVWAKRIVLAEDVSCPAGGQLDFLSLDATGKLVKGLDMGRNIKVALLAKATETAELRYFFTNEPVNSFPPTVAKSTQGICSSVGLTSGISSCSLDGVRGSSILFVGGRYLNIRVNCHATDIGLFSLELWPIR